MHNGRSLWVVEAGRRGDCPHMGNKQRPIQTIAQAAHGSGSSRHTPAWRLQYINSIPNTMPCLTPNSGLSEALQGEDPALTVTTTQPDKTLQLSLSSRKWARGRCVEYSKGTGKCRRSCQWGCQQKQQQLCGISRSRHEHSCNTQTTAPD